MTTKTAAAAPAHSAWGPSPLHIDPSAVAATFEVDGRMFEASNVLGAGYAMHIRPVVNPTLAHAMADWNDWAGAAEAARLVVAQEAAFLAKYAL